MSKTTMSDLETAIREVLHDASCRTHGHQFYTVDKKLLQVLQSEYNIHFTEPDSPQLAEIE